MVNETNRQSEIQPSATGAGIVVVCTIILAEVLRPPSWSSTRCYLTDLFPPSDDEVSNFSCLFSVAQISTLHTIRTFHHTTGVDELLLSFDIPTSYLAIVIIGQMQTE